MNLHNSLVKSVCKFQFVAIQASYELLMDAELREIFESKLNKLKAYEDAWESVQTEKSARGYFIK
jgi:hypothetical protein